MILSVSAQTIWAGGKKVPATQPATTKEIKDKSPKGNVEALETPKKEEKKKKPTGRRGSKVYVAKASPKAVKTQKEAKKKVQPVLATRLPEKQIEPEIVTTNKKIMKIVFDEKSTKQPTRKLASENKPGVKKVVKVGFADDLSEENIDPLHISVAQADKEVRSTKSDSELENKKENSTKRDVSSAISVQSDVDQIAVPMLYTEEPLKSGVLKADKKLSDPLSDLRKQSANELSDYE